MLLERLKAETAPLHDRVEAASALMSPELTIGRYIDILAAFQAFHAAWEPRIATLLADEALFDPRRKLALVNRDLAHFGVAPGRRFHSADWLVGRAEAMGSLYVLEGSTLGGRVIARHLQRRFGLVAGAGAAYFSSYGAAIGPMWTAFRARLEAFSDPAHDDAIVAGAQATFTRLIEELDRHAPPAAAGEVA
ncbi:biliverdin-producing heme oxygenase [Chthonobacter albigriseus]|uniref:biliverdin-producing heme oxygenase n=1 Tax=Chthonobacter albigriseus TaxID=1683161 RepID=UPI0015EED6B4|nr:biliverdin-producing heme oxygenase [Chthonobacter albigriseus]